MTNRGKSILGRLNRSVPQACKTIARVLANKGIRRVYCVPGDATFGLLRAMTQQGIEIYSCRSQATAVFASAADNTSESCVKSLVLVTRGPGVQNAMPAITAALAHGTPLLLLAPRENAADDAFGTFQSGFSISPPNNAPLSLHRLNNSEQAVDQLSEIVDRAVGSSRKSAIIEIERSLLGGILPEDNKAGLHRRPDTEIIGWDPETSQSLSKIAHALDTAQQPVIVVGHLARWSVDIETILDLASRLGAPICSTGLSIGFGGDALSVIPANRTHDVLREADAVLLMGAAFDWTMRFGSSINRDAKIVQLREHATTLPAKIQPDLYAIGNIGNATKSIIQTLQSNRHDAPQRQSWLRTPDTRARAPDDGTEATVATHIFRSIANSIPEHSGFIVDGSTQLIHATQSILPHHPWARFTPGASGHLGAGLGHAIGALASRKFKQMFLVSGDFSLGLGLADLETILRYELPVKILLVNNFGMASENGQMKGENPNVIAYQHSTSFAQIFQGFGGRSCQVRNHIDWDSVSGDFLAEETPYLIEILSEPQNKSGR